MNQEKMRFVNSNVLILQNNYESLKKAVLDKKVVLNMLICTYYYNLLKNMYFLYYIVFIWIPYLKVENNILNRKSPYYY